MRFDSDQGDRILSSASRLSLRSATTPTGISLCIIASRAISHVIFPVLRGLGSAIATDGQRRAPGCPIFKDNEPGRRHYGILDKELLAIVKCFEEWRPELVGLHTEEPKQVLTDRHGLEYFTKKKELNARQARWSEMLSQYNFMIDFRPGKENAAADALSRKAEDLYTRKEIQKAPREQILLSPEELSPRDK
ncbi:uncharacterized protein CPUR_05627 [Claviceps purpurea 20.1]|uniref:Reverse transcriptase RNase H-like domain-containing protein n=1 Tax=Claviceps purpurea (strain 20.1) TaxID=1111077 RepID=M1VWS3_CLAP2|nr:uncharacterized protein CPUR_05627 [Claviceps purpurea 20.1]